MGEVLGLLRTWKWGRELSASTPTPRTRALPPLPASLPPGPSLQQTSPWHWLPRACAQTCPFPPDSASSQKPPQIYLMNNDQSRPKFASLTWDHNLTTMPASVTWHKVMLLSGCQCPIYKTNVWRFSDWSTHQNHRGSWETHNAGQSPRFLSQHRGRRG